MTSIWKQVAICVALIAGAALSLQYRADIALVWSGTAAEPAPEQPRQSRNKGRPVLVALTGTLSDDRNLSVIGTGFAEKTITLRAPSSGEITEFNIEPGRNFAKGDTLLRLEDANERFAVSLAEARFQRASDERERFSRLQDSGVAAASRLEEVQTAFQIAGIELERAMDELEKRTLRAPFDGITGLAAVEIGDRIAADDTIGDFDDRSVILVEFDLPEALLGRVYTGLGVTATTPSVESRTFDGEISAIDSRVNAVTRTARVRASIDNLDDRLRPGTSFALQLDLPGKPYPAIPELALQFAQGTLHVWRISNDIAERVEVRLVRRRAGLVIVDGPLEEGDLVVVEGTQRLRSGNAVRVLNEPKAPDA